MSSIGLWLKSNRFKKKCDWKISAGRAEISFVSKNTISSFFSFSKCLRFKVEIRLCERSKTFKFSQHSSNAPSSIPSRLLWLKFRCSIVFGMFFGIAVRWRFEQSKVKFDVKLHGDINGSGILKEEDEIVYWYLWKSWKVYWATGLWKKCDEWISVFFKKKMIFMSLEKP